MDGLRAAIREACRPPEQTCVPPLLAQAAMPPEAVARAQATATRLVVALRGKRRDGVEALIQEFALSSQEGVALMCLAEALLRIPDAATRDALIRDKVGAGDWRAHLGHSPSLFVNAAAWGLMVTGKLVATSSETGLAHALARLVARGGEPLIRTGVDRAMRLMGEQFVRGETIAQALSRSRPLEARGFRYSYDMLGEAAATAEDAARYFAAYQQAIEAIGAASAGRGIHDGPGISIKLSALHPRYARAQIGRVTGELLPRLRMLAMLARRHDIGLNIDAEESDRLDISLDLLAALCFDPALSGWNGIGFVVQAYQKRAPLVIDWIVDLARRSSHRIMLRLVKGAYWDGEIKRAQVDGLSDYPVYTRKVHTDVSYLACARKLLAARDAVFPQFATHNAMTLAAIMELAGEFRAGDYEFQCLHGMGEPLYENVVGHRKLDRPCRIYAPVGTHETLLAYLVRRLLENGANTSFVNRIADPDMAVADLVADPVAVASAIAPVGAPHPAIVLPGAMFGLARVNSAGLDFSSEPELAALATACAQAEATEWRAGTGAAPRPIRNPADHRDLVGTAYDADAAAVEAALAASAACAAWPATEPARRAACLLRAADALERDRRLIGLIVREAGKSLSDALGEMREAVDFLRYYAAEIRAMPAAAQRPLGPIVCISPWNFPLAIFMGQVAAALAAGNTVLAKPAEQTPLVAAQAVRLLHAAGVPADALHLLPGDGNVGAQLVADARVRGVVFTGSTDVARHIQRSLAERLHDGRPIPLVAETGGQNALIVDSSALPEQVVADVLASAFDSAGQRCSALRILCVQADAADRVRSMLLGAMAELATGDPRLLETDVGPVIDTEAQQGIAAHVAAMRARGFPVHEAKLAPACEHGSFVPPTLIEIARVADVEREVFGPVLHMLRWNRGDLDALLADIAATGYGLTFGVHSRIDETIAHVIARSPAGNIYVNRTLIGAVVGVQPFGGHGLSGTGPKAGGPLYLRRLLADVPPFAATTGPADLPGPVGERNTYELLPRGRVLCVADTEHALRAQVEAARAVGNQALVLAPLPACLRDQARAIDDPGEAFDAVLLAGDAATVAQWNRALARRDGPIVPLHVARPDGGYALEWLLRERCVSTNTAAAGGNASLMSVG